MNYIDFLKSKMAVAPISGFDISDSDINPTLKPHQRDAVSHESGAIWIWD